MQVRKICLSHIINYRYVLIVVAVIILQDYGESTQTVQMHQRTTHCYKCVRLLAQSLNFSLFATKIYKIQFL